MHGIFAIINPCNSIMNNHKLQVLLHSMLLSYIIYTNTFIDLPQHYMDTHWQLYKYFPRNLGSSIKGYDRKQ